MKDEICVVSLKSNRFYRLKILKEKDKEEYRICNLTKGHICPCIFNSYEEAIADIKRYETEGKNKIVCKI